jgi:predicted phosphodiesterase
MKKEKWVICGDQHVPWHDKTVHATFLRFLKLYKPDGIIINGDFIDGYSVSKYLKGAIDLQLSDRTMITLEKEMIPANNILDDYDMCIPKKCKKVFIYGNHEDRLRKFVGQNLNSILGNLISPRRLLNLDRRKYEIIENYPSGYYELGHLQVAHGSKISVNASKGILDEYRHSVVNNHTHTAAITYVGGIGVKQIGICNGCMCDFNSQGMKYSKNTGRWVHSWLTVIVDPVDGSFFPELVLGYQKQFYFGGKKI